MTTSIIVGDCLDVLRGMGADSVHCVVISPPYWGLRDYGIDGAIGLEPTLDEFVAKMVEVFREVRRVLRKDGVCWVNLGSSYGSGDMRASPSPLLKRAPACGNDGREPQDSLADGRACLDCCGEHPGGTRNRHADTARNGRCEQRDMPQTSQTDRDTEPVDCDQASHSALPPDAPASTMPQSCDQPADASDPSATASAGPSGVPTSCGDVPTSERMASYTCGSVPMLPPLVVRTEGKESFYSACQSPGCRGIGRCGLCWTKLAIPALHVKPKDLIPVPWLVALALQADGWWLRSDVIWAKPNPMPESCTDRPTKAHEYMFLMTKSAKYFYDAEAVREAHADPSRYLKSEDRSGWKPRSDGKAKEWNPANVYANPAGRNLRTVWTIPTQSFKKAHFATFPQKLVEPCLKAGTSAKGCCPECGTPWGRVVEKNPAYAQWAETQRFYGEGGKGSAFKMAKTNSQAVPMSKSTTVGWKPGCECDVEPVPCLVLDPFCGSGTVGVVCKQMGLNFIGIELNPEYAEMARKRIANPNPEPEIPDVEGQLQLFEETT